MLVYFFVKKINRYENQAMFQKYFPFIISKIKNHKSLHK